MTISAELKKFLERTPDKHWIKVCRYLRVNDGTGEIIVRDNEKRFSSNVFFKNGITIERQGDDFSFHVSTVYDKCVDFSCYFTITADGNVTSGVANCFSVGIMPIDKYYVEELLEEFNAKDDSWFEWDQIDYYPDLQ